ncbi:MAG: 23S rRNA (pseudouridine(1915)-N(3))-methyltransferase RlmH [Bryobacteraceae bacterium]
MKISILFVGKPRDPNANRMAEEFVGRSSHYARIEMREVRPDRYDPFDRHPSAYKVALDPAGKLLDSAAFAALIARAEREDREFLFLVGGHDGLPRPWRDRADLLLSLSPMTWPHELARVCLAEQIYRAFATLRGHPYPR